ncbi:MAG: TonB-dependent receptor [Melioribacteraceae bacterium]|nr:TonB-dependent receptor [Melioribacteraceae bacterium]
MRIFYKYGLIILICLCTVSLHAQINDSTKSARKDILKLSIRDLMNVKVVTASRKEQNIPEAPANITVITSEMIERRGYKSLTEMFEDLPGFDFTIKQPSGEYPSHNIFRGITDVGQTKLLFMVDGIIQNDISNGWLNNMGYDFSIADVEKVELISGPGSALYGANAYAGLVHVITKEPLKNSAENYFLEAKFAYGSYNTLIPEIFAGYKFGNGLSLQLAGRLYMSDGDNGLGRPDPGNYFTDNFEPDSVLTTEYGNISNLSLSGKRKKIPDGFNASINNIYIRGKIRKDNFTMGFNYWEKKEGLGSEVVGYEYFANKNSLDYLVNHGGLTLYSTYDLELSDDLNSKSLFYYRNTKVMPETGFIYTYQYQSVNNGINNVVYDKKKGYSGEGFEMRVEQQFNIDINDDHNIIMGLLYEQKNGQYYGISLGEEQDEYSTIVGSTFTNETRSVQPFYFDKNYAAYLQDQLKLHNGFNLTTGLRYDYNNQYGSVFTPRAALLIEPARDLILKFLYGHAYKAPTLFELHDEWRGNDNLKPQKIQTSEAVINYLYSENIGIKLNYFYSHLDNLIIEAPNPDPILFPIGTSGQYATFFQNAGSTNVSGFTVSLNHLFNSSISYSVNYTRLYGENGNQLDNTAKDKINLELNFIIMDKININVRGNYTGKVKAPVTNKYFYPKSESTVRDIGYDYVVAEDADGFIDPVFLINLTVRGNNLFGDDPALEPEIIIRNIFDTKYFTPGRQAGSGIRPVSSIQPEIQNPNGFIPAYHPQPGREIIFRLNYKL